MQSTILLSFLASAIMFAFAAIVLQRFAQRRSLHNLFWGIGLLMFGLGTAAETYLTLSWNETVFRSWYVFGAILNAGWLGHGSFTLLVRRPWVRYVTAILLAMSALAVVAGFTVAVDGTAFTTAKAISEQYKQLLPAGARVRLLTPLFNVYGTIFLMGGAVYSAYLFWRRQVHRQRMVGNLLIAGGALVMAASGTLTRFFLGGSLHIAELAAAILLFSGFLLATAHAPIATSLSEQPSRP